LCVLVALFFPYSGGTSKELGLFLGGRSNPLFSPVVPTVRYDFPFPTPSESHSPFRGLVDPSPFFPLLIAADPLFFRESVLLPALDFVFLYAFLSPTPPSGTFKYAVSPPTVGRFPVPFPPCYLWSRPTWSHDGGSPHLPPPLAPPFPATLFSLPNPSPFWGVQTPFSSAKTDNPLSPRGSFFSFQFLGQASFPQGISPEARPPHRISPCPQQVIVPLAGWSFQPRFPSRDPSFSISELPLTSFGTGPPPPPGETSPVIRNPFFFLTALGALPPSPRMLYQGRFSFASGSPFPSEVWMLQDLLAFSFSVPNHQCFFFSLAASLRVCLLYGPTCVLGISFSFFSFTKGSATIVPLAMRGRRPFFTPSRVGMPSPSLRMVLSHLANSLLPAPSVF